MVGNAIIIIIMLAISASHAIIAAATTATTTIDNNNNGNSAVTEETTCFEDNTCVTFFANGTELHSGQGLNPPGSVPLEPQATLHYPNGSNSADGLTITSHQCFSENYSCVTCWSSGQCDMSRGPEEGPFLVELPEKF